jgi:hypothetical protein
MKNGKRPGKTRAQAKAAKLVKKKVARQAVIQPAAGTAPVPTPRPEPKIDFVPGPIPISDVRQEGRYVYGIIQWREPVTFGKMGIGGAGEMVYAVTHGDISAVVSRTWRVYLRSHSRERVGA